MQGEKRKRKTCTKKQKREFMKEYHMEYAKSGISFANFCKSKGVVPHTAKGWQSQLDAHDANNDHDDNDEEDYEDGPDDNEEGGGDAEEFDAAAGVEEMLIHNLISHAQGSRIQDSVEQSEPSQNNLNIDEDVNQDDDSRSSQSSIINDPSSISKQEGK